MLRLSVITDEIAQDLSHALAVMAEYGLKEAELRNVYGKYIVDADEELLVRVEQDLAAAGFTVPCIDTPLYKCALGGAEEAMGATHNAQERTLADQLPLLEKSIALAKRFNAPYIRIFAFWKRGPLTPQIEDQIAEALAPACKVAEAAGVTLLLENEHACYLGTGAETARMVARLNSPALKMLWDPGNALCAGELPFPTGWEAAKPYTAHIHVKDAKQLEDNKQQWVVVGEGDIDFKGQFEALKTSGFSGVIALETHYKHPDGPEASSRPCLEGMIKLCR
ncbi:MAG: sugar phosphate isomerase/epimerase [Armatimonadetes bacterium]|jgi:sugar phosphate isomerase/epimerase|nr:sugar phosphate isomerase/epimerase [Armatimonadota bacterium]